MKAGLVLLASCVEVAPSYKIPVTNTPTVTELAPFSFEYASDVIDDGCAPSETRDVMFELFTPIGQTYVIDTGAATTTEVAFSVHDGACPGSADRIACSSSTTIPSTNSCGTPNYNHSVLLLPGPHTYCFVVSETVPLSSGEVALRVFAGGLPAIGLDPVGLPIAGDACAGAVLPSFDCVQPAGERATAAAVVVLCPGRNRLMGGIVPDPTLAPAFVTRAILPAGPQAICATGTAGTPLPFDELDLPSPLPYWFLVQRATTTCGGFKLAVTAP